MKTQNFWIPCAVMFCFWCQKVAMLQHPRLLGQSKLRAEISNPLILSHRILVARRAFTDDNDSSQTHSSRSIAEQQQEAVWEELCRQMMNPVQGVSMEQTVEQYLDMCDYGFLNYMNRLVFKNAGLPEEAKIKAVLAEINGAMQRRLVAADERLRQILSAGNLKTMEAMARDMIRNNGVDMPFMVMLNMNIAQAKQANALQAEQVLTHLLTFIQEEQDKVVPANIRLLRLLLRTTCSGVREQMLKQKLIVDSIQIPEEERMWGPSEVRPEDLFKAMEDVLQQSAGFDQELDTGISDKIMSLQAEVRNVLK